VGDQERSDFLSEQLQAAGEALRVVCWKGYGKFSGRQSIAPDQKSECCGKWTEIPYQVERDSHGIGRIGEFCFVGAWDATPGWMNRRSIFGIHFRRGVLIVSLS
jgi:hypothetical protein